MMTTNLRNIVANKKVAYIPIYSMFDHQTGLVDLDCDGNVNRWMTNLYKINGAWAWLSIFGPASSLAKTNDIFKQFIGKLVDNFGNIEFIESEAFRGGAKAQRSSDFASKILETHKDEILGSDVIIVESQAMFMAIRDLLEDYPDKDLVYWCPVCATNLKSRTFLEADKELNEKIFAVADYIIVATKEQVEYLKECGIHDESIILVEEFIDRSLPMFNNDQFFDSDTLETVNAEIRAGKTCLYLPFRLSDEGYRIWDILDVIYVRLMSGELEVFCPNVNGSTTQEIVKLCKKAGCQLSEKMLEDAISKFKTVSSSRSTYYTLIDCCENLVIPYFEDYGFVMHAAVDELIRGKKKPRCIVLQTKEELEMLLESKTRISSSLEEIKAKKTVMDDVFTALVDSRSFKDLVARYGRMDKLPSFIFSGVGKNWYICEKVVKTFISMGIQAQALDCMHALHGDLGMLRAPGPKVLIYVSRSGTTNELVKLAKVVKAFKDKEILTELETIALFLNNSLPNKECYDSMILPDDLSILDNICEFDKRNLVPSLSIDILQLVLDLLGVLLYEGRQDLVDGYVYNHLSGGNGEKLGGDKILKDVH